MLIRLMKIEILQFPLQNKLDHLFVKMDKLLKLLFGLVLPVMVVRLNQEIQEFCLFLSLLSDINNSVAIQWVGSRGSTPRTVTLPLAQHPRTVVGTSTDANDGFVNTVACYLYSTTGFNYIIGSNTGAYGNELAYFIIIS